MHSFCGACELLRYYNVFTFANTILGSFDFRKHKFRKLIYNSLVYKCTWSCMIRPWVVFLYLFYILDLNEIIKYIVQNYSSSELQLFSSPAHDPAYSVTGYTFI